MNFESMEGHVHPFVGHPVYVWYRYAIILMRFVNPKNKDPRDEGELKIGDYKKLLLKLDSERWILTKSNPTTNVAGQMSSAQHLWTDTLTP